MFRKKLSKIMFVCLLLMTCLANPSIAFATGSGDQSGTPGVQGQKPLAYVGISLVNGVYNAAAMPVNPKFKLAFDKNVVNSLFWTNNSQCFSMKSSTNETIPIKVMKVDDTVDFEQRQFIFVQPASSLKSGTSYRLIISPNLQAKNGVAILGGTTNGRGVTVEFKTQGEAIQPAPQKTVTPAPKPETSTPTLNTANSSNGKTTSPNTVTPATLNTANSSNGKTTSPNTVTPSSAVDPTKPGNTSDIQNQSKESATVTSDSWIDPKLKSDEQTTSAYVDQSSNENKKGGISGKTWITIIGVVLMVTWITVEIIARKKRGEDLQE